MHVENRNGLRRGHALFSVFMGEDSRAGGVKGRVVVGVVEMPVCIDDDLQRSVADAI